MTSWRASSEAWTDTIGSAGSIKSWSEWLPFDFVEIGTADFRTLSQFLAGSDCSCVIGHALRTWNPNTVRGIAVEPVWHLLDRLPVLPCVRKQNVAMGSKDGMASLHFVKEDAGKRLPYSYAVWLARGTGSTIGKHPTLLKWLRRDGIIFDDVMAKATVPRWSFESLAWHHKIASIDVLKIDCEGADCDILQGVIRYCDRWPATYPRIISFETNHLSKRGDVQSMLSALRARNYVTIHQGHDTVVKRMGTGAICCDFLHGTCLNGKNCFFDHSWGARDKDVVCCYGDQCLRGHGGAAPTCIICNRHSGNNRLFCESCWATRWDGLQRGAARRNEPTKNLQRAYWETHPTRQHCEQ